MFTCSTWKRTDEVSLLALGWWSFLFELSHVPVLRSCKANVEICINCWHLLDEAPFMQLFMWSYLVYMMFFLQQPLLILVGLRKQFSWSCFLSGWNDLNLHSWSISSFATLTELDCSLQWTFITKHGRVARGVPLITYYLLSFVANTFLPVSAVQ